MVAPASDADHDGLDDDCEFALAAHFQPELVFGVEETAPERIPFWAARPDGLRGVRIFYALSYLKDGGDPTLGGISGHDGDSEFIVLRIHHAQGNIWVLDEGYLSAHYDTFCDAGGWQPYTAFAYPGSLRGKPLVYVAEGKHANYVNLSDCDAGDCFQDHCSDFARASLGISAARDLGLRGPTQELIDEYAIAGNSEYFWTDVIFCGWTRPPGDARDGCVPAANSYAIELDTYGMAYGPVGGTGLCGGCSDSLDCADGGVCMPVAGADVCGRDCATAPCPNGTHCVTLATGEAQCTPDAGCACVLACAGKACGDDSCGGSCGSCAGDETCNAAGQWFPAGPCARRSRTSRARERTCGRSTTAISRSRS